MTRNKSNLNQRSRSCEPHDEERSACEWCEYGLVVTLAAILLLGVLALTLFWLMYYREGFAWEGNVDKQFNLHPVLMIAGFVTLSGFSTLMYRICRCLRRIYVKLLHAIFHALAIPCIVLAFLAVFNYHGQKGIPHFYSLHSWLGLIAMGLFALQYAVGFFSFLLLLVCGSGTARFRASLVPIHASFGVMTFVIAIASCLTGLLEKALFDLSESYKKLADEAIVVNSIAMFLVANVIIVLFILRRDKFRVNCDNNESIRASVDL